MILKASQSDYMEQYLIASEMLQYYCLLISVSEFTSSVNSYTLFYLLDHYHQSMIEFYWIRD